MTKWVGEAWFGSELIVFRGRSMANILHAMPAMVLAMSHDAASVILDDGGRKIGGPACLIHPMTPHKVAPDRPLTIAFLGPVSRQISVSALLCERHGFAQVDPNCLPDPVVDDLASIAGRIEHLMPSNLHAIDARLSATLDLLETDPDRMSVTQAANRVGISTSRLRALASRDLGTSLSRWVTWKKLTGAARSLAEGESLAQSALMGGFVDQPHFANAMRKLLGASPSEIKAVRKQL